MDVYKPSNQNHFPLSGGIKLVNRTATCWILTDTPIAMMSFSANRCEAFISFECPEN
jgi:hypothetical protein